MFTSGDFEVMVQVVFHLLGVCSFQMGSGYDAGREGQGGAVEGFVQEVLLAGKDDGQEGFGVGGELGKGMEFLEDLHSEEGGFVNEDDDFLFFAFDGVLDLVLDEAGHDGAGVALGFHFQGPAELPIEFQDAAAGGGDSLFKQVELIEPMTPRISIQFSEILDPTAPQRIQMNITHPFQ